MARHRRKAFIITAIISMMVLSITAEESNHSAQCQSSCGSRAWQYPFGFSADCPIRFSCSDDGTAKIGEFVVQNVTSTGIFVSLPPKCDRQLETINVLFNETYAPSWRNSLFLKNCRQRSTCQIKQDYVEQQLNMTPCQSSGEDISCFSMNLTEVRGENSVNVMNNGELNQVRCQILFTSLAFESDGGGSEVSLKFELLRLEWWRKGGCRGGVCSPYANCKVVNSTAGELGHQCGCLPGFEGNGYAGGVCRRVRECRPSSFISSDCDGAGVAILVTGLVVGAVLMAGVAIACYCLRRRFCISMRKSSSAKHLLSKAASDSSIPFLAYREIQKATDNFSGERRLGTGAYGTVYKGKLHENEWVAVKRLKDRDRASLDQVMNEIKLLSSVSQPNLVRLVGCCIKGSEPILVYEFMPNGTLCQHLQREGGSSLSWLARLNIASQTAKAIAYLHSAVDPPIYHRDVKSSNILLDDEFNAKVADFGLSRLGMANLSHIHTGPQGTPGYLDPQYYRDFQLSEKSDVYSFGVVLSEILTGLKVIDFDRPHSDVNLATLAVDRIGRGCVDEIVDPSLEPDLEAWALPSIHTVAELVFRCLASQRDLRPTMTEVAEELERIRIKAEVVSPEVFGVRSSSDRGGGSSSDDIEAGKGQSEMVHGSFTAQEADDGSPVSTQDPWPSEKSSTSENG